MLKNLLLRKNKQDSQWQLPFVFFHNNPKFKKETNSFGKLTIMGGIEIIVTDSIKQGPMQYVNVPVALASWNWKVLLGNETVGFSKES